MRYVHYYEIYSLITANFHHMLHLAAATLHSPIIRLA